MSSRIGCLNLDSGCRVVCVVWYELPLYFKMHVSSVDFLIKWSIYLHYSWNIHMYGFTLPRITNTMHPALSFVATNHSLSFVPTTLIGLSLILYCVLQAPIDHHMFELFIFQRLFLWISIFIDQKAWVQVSTIAVLSGHNHSLLCPHFSKILQRYIWF